MFKKEFHVKPRTALRSSSCRQLLKEAKALYPSGWETETETSVKSPIPEKLQSAKFISHIGEKGEIFYNNEDEPVWFKAEFGGSGGQRFVPTVYTLWEFPFLLPAIWTTPSVIEKLANGADLMVPGIIVPDKGLPELAKGTVVAICCPENPAAVQAVGVLTFDTKGIENIEGAKGKAVLVAHVYKDYLWKSGSKRQMPDGTEQSSNVEDEDTKVEAGEDVKAAADGGEKTEEISPRKMDALLLIALKQLMATVLDEQHASSLLPLNASTFYSGYLVSNAPYRKEVDIKKSSYKKLVKFLKAMDKQGMIKLKDIQGVVHIKSFNWKHPDMADYVPYRVSSVTGSFAADNNIQGNHSDAKGDKDVKQTIRVVELFKPPKALLPLFGDVGAQSESGYFSRQETRNIVESYITGRDLIDSRNPRMVKLDHRLCDGLMNKEEYSKYHTYPRDKLHQRLQERLVLYTQVQIPGQSASPVKAGSPALVNILCEKKMGNKVVTRVTGLELYDIDPAAIAKELKTSCATSTSSDPIPGKKNAYQVFVQGHHSSAVCKLLEKWGLPMQLVSVVDKSGKGKKNKTNLK